MSLDIAEAVGTLRAAICGDGTALDPDGIDVSVGSGLTSLQLDVPVTLTGTLPVVGVGNLDVTMQVTMRVSSNPLAQTTTAQLRLPPQAYGTPVETGSGQVALNGLTVSPVGLNVTATLLGLPVTLAAGIRGQLLDGITTQIVAPLVTRLDQFVLGPLSRLLGVNIAGADVFAVPPEPTCNGPALRG